MKRYIPTIILVIVCVGLFWYASSQNFFTDEAVSTVKPLAPIVAEEVTAIKATVGAEITQLQRKDDTWVMTYPQALPLETHAEVYWLHTFNQVSYDEVVVESSADLASFGLSPPSQEFEVTLKDGTVKTIQFGAPLPFGEFLYVKLKDSPAVYKVNNMYQPGLALTPYNFMQKLPIVAGFNDVTSIAVTWQGVTQTIVKSDAAKTSGESTWKVGDKELTGAEGTAVLDKVLLMTTTELVKSASSIKQDQPELTITLKQIKDGAESTSSYMGKVEGDVVWIIKQGDAWAYSIPVSRIQEIIDAYKAE